MYLPQKVRPKNLTIGGAIQKMLLLFYNIIFLTSDRIAAVQFCYNYTLLLHLHKLDFLCPVIIRSDILCNRL